MIPIIIPKGNVEWTAGLIVFVIAIIVYGTAELFAKVTFWADGKDEIMKTFPKTKKDFLVNILWGFVFGVLPISIFYYIGLKIRELVKEWKELK